MTDPQTLDPNALLSQIDPGMLIASAQVRGTNIVTSKGFGIWTIDDVMAYAPPSATKVVAAIAGFSLEYDSSDHKIQAIGVNIDPIPAQGIPLQITGSFTFHDKNSDDPFTGSANILVLYLAPYWS